MITGFVLTHVCLFAILLGLVMPRYYDVFIPPHRRAEGTEETIPNQPKVQDIVDAQGADDHNNDTDGGESGLVDSSSGKKRSSDDEKS